MFEIVEASRETSERYVVVAWARSKAAALRKARKHPGSVVIHEPETVITHERYLVGVERD